ncbi:hypothetical protein CRG98_006181 [Punica granatum]|uniref:DUF7745 domain-containing protein n=1 Tax=Punica granatum TaxID=22663 RepID=A0A2I0KY60_PUNGR|nr:hypothetical protein CRG98_006181 [Punica granatum]
MISGDSFSRVSVMRSHEKVDTLKPRDPKARDAGPDESPHSGLYSLATPLGIHLVVSGSIRKNAFGARFAQLTAHFFGLSYETCHYFLIPPSTGPCLELLSVFGTLSGPFFSFQGTELAPIVEEYTTLIQWPMPTRDIVRDACHGFLLRIFGTILFPNLSNLIDGALAHVILQVVRGHSYVEATFAETIRSLDYVRDIRQGRLRGSPHLLQIWLLAHIRPFGSSHPFSCITDERSLIARLLHVFQPSDRNYTDWTQFMKELTPAQFLWTTCWNPGGLMTIGCPSVIGLPLISHLGNTLVFPARVIRQLGGLQDIPIEADRTPYHFMWADTTASLPNRMAEDQQPAIPEQDTPPMPAHSQTPLTQAIPLPIPADISTAHSGVPIGHPPPTAQTASNLVDSVRFTALERMVNQLATNMATNMIELMAMLRDQNWASSSFTPLSEHKTTADPNSIVPPIHVTDSEDISFSAMVYAPTVHPISDPLPLQPAPTAIPLPPTAFFFRGFGYACAATANPANASSKLYCPATDGPSAPPPINILPTEPGTPTQAVPPAPLINFLPKTETEQEKRMKKMEETIRALQAGSSRFDYSDSDWNLFPGMRLPPKIKIPDFKRFDGTKDPRHHLRHYQRKMLSYWDYKEFVIQTFQDSLTGSTLDWFMTLKAGDVPTWTHLSQKFLDQYRFCAETPPTLLNLSMTKIREGQTFKAYVTEWRGKAAKHIPPISERQQVQLFHSTLRGAYYSHLLAHTSSFSDLIEGDVAQPRQRKQYAPLPAPPSHIFHQLLARNKIKTEAPGPNFDPTVQNQNLRCEFHQGAPSHTLDTCWRLRDKIQEMINMK